MSRVARTQVIAQRTWLLALVVAMLALAGCASPSRAPSGPGAKSAMWQGRLALKLQTNPPQNVFANFELQGSAQAGSLTLSSPLGNTLAHMHWDANSAVLQTTGQPQGFDSLEALTRQATGTELPIASLFAWLEGIETATPGWQADLHELDAGRLTARKLTPEPAAELRIILDR